MESAAFKARPRDGRCPHHEAIANRGEDVMTVTRMQPSFEAWNTRISLKRRSPVVGKAHITCKLGPITLREPNVMPMQPSPGAWNAREVSLDEPVDPLAHRHATD
jgi:hypothetical protein